MTFLTNRSHADKVFPFVRFNCRSVIRFQVLILLLFTLAILGAHSALANSASKNSSKMMALGKTNPQPSLRDMIGQMLMLGFKGQSPKDKGSKNVHDLLKSKQIGGLIFMGRNMASKKQITELVLHLKKAAPNSLPPFLAIDQEGGQVQRLKEQHGFTPIPTASSIARGNDQILALQTYQTLADELDKAGFNVNFGPVVDLNIVPDNPIIRR